MHRLSLNFFIAIAVSSFMATSAHAQNEKARIATEVSSELQIKAMIEKLASSSFQERQQAAKDLLSVPPESLVLLETAAASSTGETQTRLRLILPELRIRLFNDQLQAFLAEPSIEMARRLPQWDRFEKISGHDDEALQIFGEILAAEPQLFAARLFPPRALSPLLLTRTAELAQKFNGIADEEFPTASVAAVMLLGSEQETRLIRATSTNISSVLDEPRFSELITDGVHAETLRAITEAWIVRTDIAAERPLLFSIKHDLKSGRTVATRIIESKSNRPDMILSLLCLAKLKSKEDLPMIESLFDNETILWPPRGQVVRRPFGATYNVRTRDVAVVAAAYLRDIEPNDIGFELRASDITLFAHDSLGFTTDEARSKALEDYRRLAGK